MDFRAPIAMETGSLDLTGGLSAIHAATSASGATSEDTRGRIKLGLACGLGNDSTLRVGTFYDGIGSDYQSRGVNLNFDMKF